MGQQVGEAGSGAGGDKALNIERRFVGEDAAQRGEKDEIGRGEPAAVAPRTPEGEEQKDRRGGRPKKEAAFLARPDRRDLILQGQGGIGMFPNVVELELVMDQEMPEGDEGADDAQTSDDRDCRT